MDVQFKIQGESCTELLYKFSPNTIFTFVGLLISSQLTKTDEQMDGETYE